jgi:HK97 family phage major capsid protein
MPNPKEGESREEFVERCIPIVMDDGTAEDSKQAVAVCNSMWEQAKKSYPVKVIKQDDKTVTIGGYGIVYGGVDLEGETFTKDTDYMPDLVPEKLVLYDHGLQNVKHVLGKTVKEDEDETGIWVEAQLSRHKKYVDEILELIGENVLGWSSGSVSHLIQREGKSIKRWPVVEYSLTPTPAEPRTLGVERIKMLAQSNPNLEALLPEEPEGSTHNATEEIEGARTEKEFLEVDKMTDKEDVIKDKQPEPEVDDKIEDKPSIEITQDELQELISTAVSGGVEKAMKALPAKPKDVKVEKDEADQEFESAGAFFQAVKNATLYPGAQDVRLKSLKAGGTGLSENVPSEGGYLLAPQIAAGLIERMYQGGQILQRVSSDNIGPNSNSMLYNAVDETSRADGSRWGGLRGYWMAEAGTITASQPAFRQMELKLKKVAALCYATDELLADAVALESWLSRTVPEELRFQVENAIYNGNGVGKPLGIMNSPCLVSVTRIDASQVDETDIANMWARRWAGVDDYVWLANPSIFPQLINLTVGNFPFLLPISSGGQGDPAFSLYGRPFIEVEYTAALGTTGDLMLASLSQYQTINKGGVQAASSIHVNFTSDETAFRFIFRTDGQPLWNSALTPYDAGNTLSPFVVLTAASA